MTLRFSDGVNIDTSGAYRVLKLADGWYVVGHGIMSPENSLDEAQAYVKELQAKEQPK